MGDIPFIIQLLKSNQIRELYEKKWYPEALYLLAMLDYLSRENNVPICKNYNDIRSSKLQRPIYPSSVIILCKTLNSDAPKEECIRLAFDAGSAGIRRHAHRAHLHVPRLYP
jgi:hypothetical protein